MARRNRRRRHQKHNFGYGREGDFACYNVLIEIYGVGHYSTRAAHQCRFRKFIKFLKQYGISDVRYVTPEHASAYAEYLVELLESRAISVAYAHNLISTLNVVMKFFRRNDDVRIVASDYFEPRKYVREKTPTVNDSSIDEATEILKKSGNDRGAALLGLVRFFGLRLREAILADLDRWWREYKKTGYVTVLDGTKGGRKALDRQIRVTPEGLKALEYAISVRPEKSLNLLHPEELLKGFLNTVVKKMRLILKEYEILNIREVRTYFMIELFEQVTGLQAPVKNRSTLENEALLLKGYEAVAKASGHDRISVARAYVG